MIALAMSPALAQKQPPELSVGDRAPNSVFRTPEGKPFPLTSLRGKIVVLEFTAFACAPCCDLAPHYEAFAARTPDVVFLTISTDSLEDSDRTLALRPKEARTIFLRDPFSKDRSKMEVWKFGNVAVPTMFVIARDGTMASRLIQEGVEGLPRLQARIAWARARPVR